MHVSDQWVFVQTNMITNYKFQTCIFSSKRVSQYIVLNWFLISRNIIVKTGRFTLEAFKILFSRIKEFAVTVGSSILKSKSCLFKFTIFLYSCVIIIIPTSVIDWHGTLSFSDPISFFLMRGPSSFNMYLCVHCAYYLIGNILANPFLQTVRTYIFNHNWGKE